jgi:hypothetical protein
MYSHLVFLLVGLPRSCKACKWEAQLAGDIVEPGKEDSIVADAGVLVRLVRSRVGEALAALDSEAHLFMMEPESHSPDESTLRTLHILPHLSGNCLRLNLCPGLKNAR